MSNSKGTILIGGGRGFIGAHICTALLKDGFSVISVDSGLFKPSPVFLKSCTLPYLIDLTADASDYECLFSQIESKKSLQAVINCIGPARPSYFMENPILTASTLMNSTHSLLRLASHFNALYIHASSSDIYGNSTGEAIKEDGIALGDTLSLRSPYAEAKRFSETLTMSFVRERGLCAIILRLFNVYGSGFAPDDDRVVAAFIHSLLKGEAIEIHGDGKQTRSFCFINDIVRAFEYSMSYDASFFLCVNIGNPEPISILDLAGLMKQLSNREITIEHTKVRQDDVMHRVPDISKARDTLGWWPEVGLEEGLKKTLFDYSLVSKSDSRRISRGKRRN
ncbi:MAG: NAD-dependent epimerase/dehydratase family protein [Planctomycetota bacterium]|jgi:nucleoside-diphosphate-sugar epimerase